MNKPTCFGKSWDPKDPACKGGTDPAYTNQRDGSHVRERCDWFTLCGQQKSSNEATANPNLVPASMLNPASRVPFFKSYPPPPAGGNVPPRPPVPPTPPVGSYQRYQQTHQTQQAQQAPAYGQQYQHQHYPAYGYAPAPPAPMVHPYVAAMGPQTVAAPHQMPTAQVPYYLTVPEPVGPHDSFWGRLVKEIVRSIFKSGGHTIASFFDHNPFSRYSVDPNKYNNPQ